MWKIWFMPRNLNFCFSISLIGGMPFRNFEFYFSAWSSCNSVSRHLGSLWSNLVCSWLLKKTECKGQETVKTSASFHAIILCIPNKKRPHTSSKNIKKNVGFHFFSFSSAMSILYQDHIQIISRIYRSYPDHIKILSKSYPDHILIISISYQDHI